MQWVVKIVFFNIKISFKMKKDKITNNEELPVEPVAPIEVDPREEKARRNAAEAAARQAESIKNAVAILISSVEKEMRSAMSNIPYPCQLSVVETSPLGEVVFGFVITRIEDGLLAEELTKEVLPIVDDKIEEA